MARTVAWLLAVLMLAAVPSWAQQTKIDLVQLNPKTKCWDETSQKFIFAINIDKPNIFVFLVMRGATTKADETSSIHWKNRVPAFWRNTEEGSPASRIVDFTEYDDQTAFAEILTPGQYVFMVADKNLRGLRGYAKLCLRSTAQL